MTQFFTFHNLFSFGNSELHVRALSVSCMRIEVESVAKETSRLCALNG